MLYIVCFAFFKLPIRIECVCVCGRHISVNSARPSDCIDTRVYIYISFIFTFAKSYA